MVALLAGTVYYKALLEGLYSDLGALDTSDYAWDTSDRWTQARYLSPQDGGTRHLETWIDLGAATDIGRSMIAHEASLTFACRYKPDDDSTSQGRMHAAARHAVDFLLAWSHPSGARARPTRYAIEGISVDWLAVTVTFTLLLPRG